MCRTIFIYSTVLTLLATTYSKSVKNDEEIENTTSERLATTFSNLPLIESESDAKQSAKRSLLILMPMDEKRKTRTVEEAQDIIRKNQKTKRCKTPLRRERGSLPTLGERTNQNILGSKNINSYNGERVTGYSMNQSPRLRLVPLKNPDTAAKRDPTPREKGEGAADRGDNVNVMKAIREKLQSRDYNVGAARSNFLRKTNIIDDDKYICYCREKSNPTIRKEATRNFNPKPNLPEWLPRKNKPERKDDNKVFLGENKLRQKPIYANAQHQPFLPALYPDAHQYLPALLPNHVNPVLQQKGNEKVPYVPYYYQIDPELAMLPEVIHRTDPTKVNIPYNFVGGSPDALVGQSINRGHDLHNNQQVGQRACSPTVGKKPVQLFQATIPATSLKPFTTNMVKSNDPYYSTKIDEGSAKGQPREDPTVPEYNLQSAHSKLPGYTTLTSVDDRDHTDSLGISNDDSEKEMEEKEEVSSEVPLRATNSGDDFFNEAKSVAPKNDFSDKYETTDSGALDYSEIKEVTSAYFETSGYSDNSEPSSFDHFHAHSDGPTSPTGDMDYDANVQSGLNPTAQTLGSDEIATGMVKSSDEDSEHQTSPNEDFEYQLSPNEASGFEVGAIKCQDGKDIVGKSNSFGKGQESAIDDSNQNADYIMQPDLNDPDYHEAKSFGSAEETPLITEGLTPPNEADVSKEIDTKDTQSGEEFFKEDHSFESPEMEDNGGPLRNDYEENFESDKLQQKIQDMDEKEEEEDPAGEPSMDETMGSVDPESDIEMGEDTINMDNENVMATVPYDNESDNEKSMLKLSDIEGAGKTIDPSEQALPFCDNALLQKAIKAVINNFATDSEMEENANAETVGSTGEELLQEVVNVPNLRNIVSLPAIEHTILDKVKNLLARVTGVPRTHFDRDWATNIIRDNLRNTMAAAPGSNGELPPMTVAEHQFRNGKWVTNLVTLEPTSNEAVQPLSDLERLQATVKSLLHDPAVGLQAAKQPTVQNMIVQSVRKTFKPKNETNDEVLDDSVIQGALDNELSLMEMEDPEMTTIGDAAESETVDVSNMDMNKFLEIARNEAGVSDDKKDESLISNPSEDALIDSDACENSPVTSVFKESTGGVPSDTSDVVNAAQSESRPDKEKPENVASLYRKDVSSEHEDEKRMTNSAETSETSASIKLLPEGSVETVVSSTTEPFSYNLVAATRNSEFTQHLESSSTEAIVRPTVQADRVAEELEEKETPEESVEDRELQLTTSTVEVPETSKHKSISTETPSNIVAAVPANQDKDQENAGEMEESVNRELPSNDASPEHDFTYLGKISVKKNNNDTDDVQSLQNSELYYVGDGVKLPLEIRKLDDGSYALSISRIVCEQLLNKECPCCVPVEGHVVRTVRRTAEEKDADKTIGTNRRTKRISKRESFKSSLPDVRKKYDPADDSLQIFSMPVETFARRYNLSLNLEKVQAPWNFEAKGKIDEHPNGRAKNSQNKEENNADADYRHDLLSLHGIPANGNSEATMVRVQRRDDNSDKDSDVMDYKYRLRKERRRNFNRYRYERNIDEPVNERAEIVKNVLNFVREMILNMASEE